MKRFAIVVSLLLPCLLTVSCGKENNGNEVAEPAQLGVVVKDVEGIVEVPKSLSGKQKELVRDFERSTSEKNYPKRRSFFDKIKKLFND